MLKSISSKKNNVDKFFLLVLLQQEIDENEFSRLFMKIYVGIQAKTRVWKEDPPKTEGLKMLEDQEISTNSNSALYSELPYPICQLCYMFIYELSNRTDDDLRSNITILFMETSEYS